MNNPLKITKIGNSAGIFLPKDVLARLRVRSGDALYLSEAPDGVRLTAINPDFTAKMETTEEIMREDRDILRELAVAENPSTHPRTHGSSVRSTQISPL